MHSAAGYGHKTIVRLLLSTDGVDPELVDSEGQTVLALVTEDVHVDIVHILRNHRIGKGYATGMMTICSLISIWIKLFHRRSGWKPSNIDGESFYTGSSGLAQIPWDGDSTKKEIAKGALH